MGVQFKQRSACNVKPLGIYLPRNLCGIVSRRYFAVLMKASPIHATRYIIKVFAWPPLTAYRHSSLSIDDPLGAVCKYRFDRAAVFSFGKWRWAIDGAIFVPFQHKDRQQYWNALPLEKAGAAKIIEQKDFSAAAVADLMAGWDRTHLMEMARAARAAAIPDATERVAAEVVAASKK